MASVELIEAPSGVVETSVPTTPRRGITRYLLARIGSGLLVVWLALSLVFFVFRALPGSADLRLLLGANGRELSAEQIATARADLGLDQPILTQYLTYFGDLLHGDLGTSYLLKKPVSEIVFAPFGATLVLTLAALVLAWLLALGGTVATSGRRAIIESPARVVEIVAASMPQFWLGIVLLVVFAIGLHWFPVAGGNDLRALVLPAFALAIPIAGLLAQLSRQTFEEALEQHFVLSARARGFSDLQVRLRYALRHALTPALALSGQAVGWLIGGAIIIEEIFARPGIGRVIFQAVNARDLPVILGVVVVVAIGYVVVNILVDLLQRVIDPRTEAAR